MSSTKRMPLNGIGALLLAGRRLSPSRGRDAPKQPKNRRASDLLPYVYDYLGIDRQALLDSGRYPHLAAEAQLLDGFIEAAKIYWEAAQRHLAAGNERMIIDTQNLHDLAVFGLHFAMKRQSALLYDVDELIKKGARAEGRLGKRGPASSGRALRNVLTRHLGLASKPGRKSKYAHIFTREVVDELHQFGDEIAREDGKRPTDRWLVTEYLKASVEGTSKRVTTVQIDGGCKAFSAAKRKS